MSDPVKRLSKSRSDRMIDGVCGGIARYFDIDSTLVRITFVLLTFLGGAGAILYIVAMIIMPAEQFVQAATPSQASSSSNHKVWGFLLIAVGIFWLGHTMGFHIWPYVWAFPWRIAFPVLLILGGVAFLYGGRNYVSAAQPGTADAAAPGGGAPGEERTRLYRSRSEKKLFGVCGGIAKYFDIDPVIIRLVFVLGAIASFGFALLGYLILAIIMAKEPLIFPPSTQ
jgi:phage shock protein PspC (stress-responsive transcriptional regulator)